MPERPTKRIRFICMVSVDFCADLHKTVRMDTIERLKIHVSSRGAITAIARKSGCDWYTVKRIATKKTKSPGIETVKAIERALDELYPETPPPPTPGQSPDYERPDSAAPGREEGE